MTDKEFKHKYGEILTLSSYSLMTKWGFMDGDQFSDYVHSNYNVKWNLEEQERPMDTELLKRLVEKYLIPALPTPVRLDCFPTPHNGIRVHPDDYEELATQPETVVEITQEQLKEMCEEIKHQYLKEVNN